MALIGEMWSNFKDEVSFRMGGGMGGSSKSGGKGKLGIVAILALILFVWSWWVSREPDTLWVNWEVNGQPAPSGYATADTLIQVADTLLHKHGGYLSNDIMPPGVYLDNMPNWEFGVLVQVRDLAKVMRNDYSRSQSQSIENKHLAQADPAFSNQNDKWIFPSAESKYQEGIDHVTAYREQLISGSAGGAGFYPRADNLREWLSVVEKRLGSLSQRLSASVGQSRVDMDQGEAANVDVKTPWYEIDDVVFEARGSAWALLHFLRAAEHDFKQVLKDKNAEVSLRQIIRELEASIEPIRSPMILNGSGYGFFANHSLVTASYLSRANSAVINLRELLDQG
jgi:hypothetical protein